MSQIHDVQDASGVIVREPGQGVLMIRGTSVPSDTTAGYLPGCIYIKTNGATAITVIYVNTGTLASCAFKPLYPAAQGAALTAQLTTLTPADAAGTPDYAIAAITNSSPFGFASAQEAITVLYVIANLQVRLAEVEARLEAANIVASN